MYWSKKTSKSDFNVNYKYIKDNASKFSLNAIFNDLKDKFPKLILFPKFNQANKMIALFITFEDKVKTGRLNY